MAEPVNAIVQLSSYTILVSTWSTSVPKHHTRDRFNHFAVEERSTSLEYLMEMESFHGSFRRFSGVFACRVQMT